MSGSINAWRLDRILCRMSFIWRCYQMPYHCSRFHPSPSMLASKVASSSPAIFVRDFTAYPASPSSTSVPKSSLKQAQDSYSMPYKLVEEDLVGLYQDIKSELACDLPELEELARYYFSSQGKAFRPMVVLLMASACVKHVGCESSDVMKKQRRVAVIAEMIHTASLIHDDVIDDADIRRNQPSLHKIHSIKSAVLTGDYILSVASRELARLRNPDVIICLAQVIEDLVKGELMQIRPKDDAPADFLSSYLSKTYHKTASLLANSCKAVALLSDCPPDVTERAFQFGKNLGMAFQLVDDNLDFLATTEEMGKPTSVDLKLGLATAPVLFAAQKAPELNMLIQRKFQYAGDIELAREAVSKYDGIGQSKRLALRYSEEAVLQLSGFANSVEQEGLVKVADMVVHRAK